MLLGQRTNSEGALTNNLDTLVRIRMLGHDHTGFGVKPQTPGCREIC